MLRRDERHDADVRLRDPGESLKLARRRHAELEDRGAMLARDSRKIVSGTPTSLLKFPSVASAGPRVRRIAPSISFVVVFPFEPPTAAIGIANRRRWKAPRAPRAPSVSSTSKSGRPGTAGVPRRTTAAPAPFAFASARNVVRVEALALQRDEERARRNRPRVRRDGRKRRRRGRGRGRSRRARDLLRREEVSVESVARLLRGCSRRPPSGSSSSRTPRAGGRRPSCASRSCGRTRPPSASRARRRRRRRTRGARSSSDGERHFLLLAEVDELPVDAEARRARSCSR